MGRKIFILVIIIPVLTFISCKTLPMLEPADNKIFHDNAGFLKGKYRLTYSIKAELPNGDNALLIGATFVDTGACVINAVIMTVEGIVLLDAEYKDNAISVKRSIPPFDSASFSQGLMDDIKLVYLTPDCPVEQGMLGGSFVKRYKCGKSTVDIGANGNSLTVISKYDENGKLVRTAHVSYKKNEDFPDRIELIAHGFFGYSLLLELIDSEKL